MTTERRRYFRIDDSALIKYCEVAAQDLATARAEIAAHLLRADNMRDARRPLDARMAELGPALRRESRVIAEAIDLLNRKLGLLAGVLALESTRGAEHGHHEHQPTIINLSGGGLAVRTQQPLNCAWLTIDLLLLPDSQVVRTLGRVVDSRALESGFVVGVEFDGLREEDRDTLVSHVLRKQAQMLRRERGGGEQQV